MAGSTVQKMSRAARSLASAFSILMERKLQPFFLDWQDGGSIDQRYDSHFSLMLGDTLSAHRTMLSIHHLYSSLHLGILTRNSIQSHACTSPFPMHSLLLIRNQILLGRHCVSGLDWLVICQRAHIHQSTELGNNGGQKGGVEPKVGSSMLHHQEGRIFSLFPSGVRQ